jgi:hypothetical protein
MLKRWRSWSITPFTVASLVCSSTLLFAQRPGENKSVTLTSTQGINLLGGDSTSNGGSIEVGGTVEVRSSKEATGVLKESAEVGGTFIRVGWTLSAPVGAYVFLSEKPIKVGYDDEGWLDIEGEHLYIGTRDSDEDPSITFTNLDQDRTYYIAYLPHSHPDFGAGKVIPTYRTATTLQRNLTVKVMKVELIDDSDDLSAGDVAFSFQLMPTSILPKEITSNADVFDSLRYPEIISDVYLNNDYPGGPYLHIDSGETIPILQTMKVQNIGDSIRIAASCYDDDVSLGGVYDVSHIPTSSIDYLSTFDADHGEANSSHWVFDIDGGSFEADLDSSHPPAELEQFNFSSTRTVYESSESCLCYKVTFKFSISYSDNIPE